MNGNSDPVKQVRNRGIVRDAKGCFKKGFTGNPAGRPRRGCTIAEILNELLDAEKEDGTVREAILKKVVDLALNGDMRCIEWIADRTEGNALERIVKHKSYDVIEIL
jgi:hypothetical protein